MWRSNFLTILPIKLSSFSGSFLENCSFRMRLLFSLWSWSSSEDHLILFISLPVSTHGLIFYLPSPPCEWGLGCLAEMAGDVFMGDQGHRCTGCQPRAGTQTCLPPAEQWCISPKCSKNGLKCDKTRSMRPHECFHMAPAGKQTQQSFLD